LIDLGSAAVRLVCDLALTDPDVKVRAAAVRILGEIGDPVAGWELRRALADPRVQIRAAAAEALGRIGDPEAIPALTKAIADPELRVGCAAVAALQRIGDPRAIPALCRAMHHDSYRSVAEAAAAALAAIRDPRAVKPLCRLLAVRQKSVRILAAGALEGLAGKTRAPELSAALERLDRLTAQAPARVRGDSVYARAAAAIRAATSEAASLPRPAEAPPMDLSVLPVPARPIPGGDTVKRKRCYWSIVRGWLSRSSTK
jgi:hypothetical protein